MAFYKGIHRYKYKNGGYFCCFIAASINVPVLGIDLTGKMCFGNIFSSYPITLFYFPTSSGWLYVCEDLSAKQAGRDAGVLPERGHLSTGR